jgi:hypothetical protein
MHPRLQCGIALHDKMSDPLRRQFSPVTESPPFDTDGCRSDKKGRERERRILRQQDEAIIIHAAWFRLNECLAD